MIRVGLNHKTIYQYDRPTSLGPQVVRLRPAPHSRTPVCSYSMKIQPQDHFINWQQDPHSNYLARLVFNKPTRLFEVEVDLVVEMTVLNPFDYFLEDSANEFPFEYESVLKKDLQPFLHTDEVGPELSALLQEIDRRPRRTMDFMVDLNQMLQRRVGYVIRLEPGVQTPEETLQKSMGSCRDSAWLMVQMLRNLGLAARFVSGYLIQLKPDVISLDGPSGASEDFTDLHAWAEVFLPGAGWIGLDPTSGLLAGEGHIPLACTPEPVSAAPITGTTGPCEVEFRHEMTVTRIHEDPRVTKPYTEETWKQIEALGAEVDARLEAGDVRLTMGGEPTFVSIDDMESAEWNTSAVGPTKQRLGSELIQKLRDRFAPAGLLHYGQGKWYPGESLPRWALTCLWRTDGEPIWNNPELLADSSQSYGHTVEHAQRFMHTLTNLLGVNPEHASLAYEDGLYYLWKEQRLAANADLKDENTTNKETRRKLASLLAQGLNSPVGCMLPIAQQWWNADARWISGVWPLPSEYLYLIPGDSPMGLRLPLDSLPVKNLKDYSANALVPFAEEEPVPSYQQLVQHVAPRQAVAFNGVYVQRPVPQPAGVGGSRTDGGNYPGHGYGSGQGGHGDGNQFDSSGSSETPPSSPYYTQTDDGAIVRTALCIEPRNGTLHVFMPPVDRLEGYLELLAAIEQTSEELQVPVVIEGYLPPPDHRLQHLKVTPDPGVIEVNVQPAKNWKELVDITGGLYEDAFYTRLGTEKFDADGSHTGTGGGNHIVMGAQTPAESPFLRRPDLLRSLIGYWHNHPSLSYLFSGKFVGPTSQAPRVDEGRRDAGYELQIAFQQIPEQGECPPWMVDRIFRHLLVDITGNTHRAEFCIDKLFSPDSSTGRLGLVEFRAFEMPPHWQMSLTQQLLLRALVARFWENPYNTNLVDWDTSIHDRWLLPHFIQQDFEDVISETQDAGMPLDASWFGPHFEFRFPVIGEASVRGMYMELRDAIEPWYVLGEEPAGGATARYVDSSVERLQVKVRGLTDQRHVITCNGRKVPLHPTGTEGEYVAAVRYRGWQPPSCLHPTIPVDEPLVFDVLDTWLKKSLGGCKYHVGHPGGNNPEKFPVNAYEAESRRAARFFKMGHTGGSMQVPIDEKNHAFPMTLDLRRNRTTR